MVCIGEKKEVYRLLRPRMREHFRYASRAPPSRTGARNLKDGPFSGVLSPPCHIAKFCLHVLSHRHVLSPRYKTYRKIHSVHGLSLFSSNIVIHLSSSLDVCRCTWMHSRAVLRCVLLSPLQIMIKMNLFCVLGRLQGHRCQLCQTWLRRYWIILRFEHVLWMPYRCNTFDGRLLWFDEVEGKRGLTLTVSFLLFFFFFFVGAGGVGGQTVCIVRTGVHGILCA